MEAETIGNKDESWEFREETKPRSARHELKLEINDTSTSGITAKQRRLKMSLTQVQNA